MDEPTFDSLETRLREAGLRFPYPDAPDLIRVEAVRQVIRRPGRPVRQWRLAWVAVSVLVLVLLAALATPTVRAAVLEFIQIGVVRIFQFAPTPLPESPVTATPQPIVTGTPASTLTPAETTGLGNSPTLTSRPTPIDLVSVLDLEGQTTLDEARARVHFPIRMPSYPPDLGPPDRVILQDHNGAVLILVWTQPESPEKARLSLHAIEPGSWTVEKVKPLFIQETSVNGQPAVWAVGPYLMYLRNGDLDIRRLIDGHVLIWTDGDITYRLETDLPMEEAVRIAESLK